MTKRIIIAGAATIAVCLLATSCADTVTEYTEYDPTGKVVTKHYTKSEQGFNPAWSAGSGKTIDLHPEATILSAP